MNKIKVVLHFVALVLVNLNVNQQALASPMDHSKHQTSTQSKRSAPLGKENCKIIDATCGKTITSAFSPSGDLWRVWSQQGKIHYQISKDNGQNFDDAKTVNIPEEKISARNENRPKIAFDSTQGVYLSWAMAREKKYTADIRYSYSSDYGNTFTAPITINDDGLLAGHSFNEMAVNDEGEVSIVWLDGRLKQRKGAGNGSAIFIATGNMTKVTEPFVNQEVVNGTCVCCRLAVDYNQQGNLAIFWRHIYGDNIREFAITTLSEQSTPYQVSYDHWKINGCPHQGGALAIDKSNRYHMVWYNQGDKGKGVFYAYSDSSGKTLSSPLAVGEQAAQAAHPHMNENNEVVDIVWTQFTGAVHQLWHQQSTNKGLSFGEAKVLATSTKGSDRPFIIQKGNSSFVSWHRFQQGHWVSQL
jgi:hypothetical protein